MTNRKIIEWNLDLKDSQLTKKQQAIIYDLIEEDCEGFSLHDKEGTCSQAEIHVK